MKKANTWYENQDRTSKKTYQPKWTPATIKSIILDLESMTDLPDLQYKLVKQYDIGLRSAELWVEMTRRIMKDMGNGMTLEQAIETDRVRRNLIRSRKKAQTK